MPGGRASETLTFVFTDIEDSTATWEADPDAMSAALADHDGAVRGAIEEHAGRVFTETGDGFGAVFARADDALAAARTMQRRLADGRAGHGIRLRIRIGAHTGVAEERGGNYFGSAVNRAARVAALASGGQVLVSEVTARLAVRHRPMLVEAGWRRLKGFSGHERIFALDWNGTGEAGVHRIDLVGRLPRQRPLVGRDHVIDAVDARLEPGSVVSLVGSGGIGKTSLSIAVAHRARARFADGAWFVDLSGCGDASDVLPSVIAALGVVVLGSPAVVEDVAAALAGQQRLVVLDNCEHVLDDAGRLVTALLDRCEGVAVLTTSREPLGFRDEQVVRVGPLSRSDGPGPSDAARLLVDRISAAGGTVGDDDPLVRRACELVDGVPLAIEMVAARAAALGLDEVVRGLHVPGSLGGGPADGPDRHRSLHELIGWSFGLLSGRQQRLLRRLAVFAGTFDLAAVRAVCAEDAEDPADDLAVLVRRSLVTGVPSPVGTRYRLLVLVRHFAQGELERSRDDATWVTSRLVRHYAAWMRAAADGLASGDEARWHARTVLEWDNLRGALHRAVALGLTAEACSITADAAGWALDRRALEVGEWAAAALGLPGAEREPTYTGVLYAGFLVATAQGRSEEGERLQRLAADHDATHDAAPQPWAALMRLTAETRAGVTSEATIAEVRRRVAVGSRVWLACEFVEALPVMLRAMPGRVEAGELDVAVAAMRRSVALARQVGAAPSTMSRQLDGLGVLLVALDLNEALRTLEQALELAEESGSPVAVYEVAGDLIQVYARCGRVVDALRLAADQVRSARRAGARREAVLRSWSAFEALVASGDLTGAARVLAHLRRHAPGSDWIGYYASEALVTRLESELDRPTLERVDAEVAASSEDAFVDRTLAAIDAALATSQPAATA